jgi:nicotinamide phosphoribosyltransferase
MAHNILSDNFEQVALQRAKLWEQLKLLGDPRTIERPEDNTICDTDSYKLCHSAMYKILGVTAAFSYIEPRIVGEKVMFVGLQLWCKRFRPITDEMIDKAEEFFSLHIQDGDKLFPRKDWKKVVDVYGGYPPLTIRALPEGTIIDSQNALVTIECTDPELAWMAAYFETTILRAIWYPVTVASRSRKIRNIMKNYIAETSDIDIETAIAFMFHDFGARGGSSKETVGIGGFAHLATGALGSDTITGVLFANKYYNCQMSGFSVFATEHSLMTMRGKSGELQTVRDLIKTYNQRPHTIVSIVSDGYSIWELAKHYCTTLKQEILESGIQLVVRPDSGDPVTVILGLLKMFDEHYGSIVNSKGYKVLNVVRILQGDSLSTPEDFERIMIAVENAKFSIENMVFGQGGGLLQQVNRDTYKFAMKTCAAEVNGVWVDVFKDPITDQGKRSKKGRLTVAKNLIGEYQTIRIEELDTNHTEVMETVWVNGQLLVDHSVDDIRKRAN